MNYENYVERAANALLQWEKSTEFAAVARFYQLSYEYTCKALVLQVKDKEEVFKDISKKVIEKRVI